MDGFVKLSVPAGWMSLRVERGLEYYPILETITINLEELPRHRVALSRWIIQLCPVGGRQK